jgi:hypothetical protein
MKLQHTNARAVKEVHHLFIKQQLARIRTVRASKESKRVLNETTVTTVLPVRALKEMQPGCTENNAYNSQNNAYMSTNYYAFFHLMNVSALWTVRAFTNMQCKRMGHVQCSTVQCVQATITMKECKHMLIH